VSDALLTFTRDTLELHAVVSAATALAAATAAAAAASTARAVTTGSGDGVTSHIAASSSSAVLAPRKPRIRARVLKKPAVTSGPCVTSAGAGTVTMPQDVARSDMSFSDASAKATELLVQQRLDRARDRAKDDWKAAAENRQQHTRAKKQRKVDAAEARRCLWRDDAIAEVGDGSLEANEHCSAGSEGHWDPCDPLMRSFDAEAPTTSVFYDAHNDQLHAYDSDDYDAADMGFDEGYAPAPESGPGSTKSPSQHTWSRSTQPPWSYDGSVGLQSSAQESEDAAERYYSRHPPEAAPAAARPAAASSGGQQHRGIIHAPLAYFPAARAASYASANDPDGIPGGGNSFGGYADDEWAALEESPSAPQAAALAGFGYSASESLRREWGGQSSRRT
jgi:hypothetical protein